MVLVVPVSVLVVSNNGGVWSGDGCASFMNYSR